MRADETAFAAEWRSWQGERLRELNAVDGPSTLRATHWLDEGDTVPGVSGAWNVRDGEVVLRLDDGREVVALDRKSVV